jgi:hypothetical protein
MKLCRFCHQRYSSPLWYSTPDTGPQNLFIILLGGFVLLGGHQVFIQAIEIFHHDEVILHGGLDLIGIVAFQVLQNAQGGKSY